MQKKAGKMGGMGKAPMAKMPSKAEMGRMMKAMMGKAKRKK